MDFETEKELGHIPRGKRECIKLRYVVKNGLSMLDIRIFFVHRATGQWVSTKKGVAIPINKLGPLVRAINRLVVIKIKEVEAWPETKESEKDQQK